MARLVRAALVFIILGLILFAATWGYDHFLAPDRAVLIRTRVINAARRAAASSNYAEALNAIEQGAVEIDGADWELLTWQAALLEKLGRPSHDVLAQALEAGASEDVWITYGMAAMLVDEPALALTAGEQLIGRNPDSAQGYYLLAQAYDALAQVDDALNNYAYVLKKIDETGGNEALYIAVRQRVAQLNIELLQDEITFK